MNTKTIIVSIILFFVVLWGLRSLWKFAKGETGCGCGSKSCSSKKDDNGSCGCHKG